MRPSRRIRHWLPFLPLLALLGATYWLDQQAQPDLATAVFRPRHDPDAIVDGFSATTLSQSGTPSFIVHAGKMLHFSDDDSTNLEAPHITLLDERNLPLYASAQSGIISSKGKEIILSGGVAVQREASNQNRTLNLRTDYLRVLPDQGLMETDRPVELTEPDSTVSAVGLELNNNTRTLKLLSRVRTEYASAAN
jgi:lipopolysaccharide export system protein LptC